MYVSLIYYSEGVCIFLLGFLPSGTADYSDLFGKLALFQNSHLSKSLRELKYLRLYIQFFFCCFVLRYMQVDSFVQGTGHPAYVAFW